MSQWWNIIDSVKNKGNEFIEICREDLLEFGNTVSTDVVNITKSENNESVAKSIFQSFNSGIHYINNQFVGAHDEDMDMELIHVEPKDEAFVEWNESFDVKMFEDEIVESLNRENVRLLFDRKVENGELSVNEFWSKFFFVKRKSQKQKAKREELLKQAEKNLEMDSNLSLEFDFDELEDDIGFVEETVEKSSSHNTDNTSKEDDPALENEEDWLNWE